MADTEIYDDCCAPTADIGWQPTLIIDHLEAFQVVADWKFVRNGKSLILADYGETH